MYEILPISEPLALLTLFLQSICQRLRFCLYFLPLRPLLLLLPRRPPPAEVGDDVHPEGEDHQGLGDGRRPGEGGHGRMHHVLGDVETGSR